MEAVQPAVLPAAAATAASFGTLPRCYRLAAGLTQEELVERAGA